MEWIKNAVTQKKKKNYNHNDDENCFMMKKKTKTVKIGNNFYFVHLKYETEDGWKKN